uniref:PX domain-containing protein n=1 Tax=Acrobeloides nanus TaxID=290746 RepID=A0A914EBD6_9BILA
MISGDDLLSVSDEENDSIKKEKPVTASKLVIEPSAPEDSSISVDQAAASTQPEEDVDETFESFLKNGNIEVSIRAYEKRGEGINAYLVYKIETRVTNIPGFSKNFYEVWRRFSDFLGLREKLVEKYQHKGIIVPFAPEKSIAALTKTKLNSSSADEHNANEQAEKRSRYLQRFLCRLARHPRLVTDCDFRDFLTMEADLPKSSSTSALSSTSMKKLFKSMGDVFSKIAFPMDENDRWFEQVHSQVEELDEMLVREHGLFENLVTYRRDLSISDEQLSKALSLLASCEENTALARTLSKLAETHESLSMVERHESEQDQQILSEALAEHLQLINVLKEVFYERVKAWQNWQNQQQALTKKREMKARFDLAGKSDKAAQCKEELKDYENRVDQMEKEFLAMSKVIRTEYTRIGEQRRIDIKKVLVHYFESLLESEQQALQYWEKFVPETRNIL